MDLREAIDLINEALAVLYAELQEKGYDYGVQQSIDALEIAIDCIQYKIGMG